MGYVNWCIGAVVKGCGGRRGEIPAFRCVGNGTCPFRDCACADRFGLRTLGREAERVCFHGNGGRRGQMWDVWDQLTM